MFVVPDILKFFQKLNYQFLSLYFEIIRPSQEILKPKVPYIHYPDVSIHDIFHYYSTLAKPENNWHNTRFV